MTRRDETGAVAVLVAVMAVFLLGLTAFTADFGLAYANKRQIQTAADAAVLGAASELAEYPGNCAALIAVGGSSARTEALAKVPLNDMNSLPATLGSDYAATCVGGVPTVSTSVTANATRVFGNVFGSGDYALSRAAAAIVEVPQSALGLRPLAICSSDLTGVALLPSTVVKLTGPGGGLDALSCPDAGRSGNWWTIDCPGSTNGDLAANIANGCSSEVAIVPGQPLPGSPSLPGYLTGYCGSINQSCLASNPGNVRSNGAQDAMNSLVDTAKDVILPVFCGSPSCVPAGITDNGGENTIYPVHKFIGVQICGFHWGSRNSTSAQMTGLCGSANNPLGFNPATGNNQDNYLLVVVKQIQISGSTTPSSCKVGDPCDTGLRQVRLVAGPYTE